MGVCVDLGVAVAVGAAASATVRAGTSVAVAVGTAVLVAVAVGRAVGDDTASAGALDTNDACWVVGEAPQAASTSPTSSKLDNNKCFIISNVMLRMSIYTQFSIPPEAGVLRVMSKSESIA